MGYDTDFTGCFNVTPTLKPEHAAYLEKFAETRRMERDASKAELLDDPVRVAAGLAIGDEGGYFVGGGGFAGQDHDASVINYNTPPDGQPGLWCKWAPASGGTTIEWNEGEKFYNYIEWIKYLIERFLKPWGYSLNGTVEWTGEDSEDRGRICITDNVVRIQKAVVTWQDE